MFKAPKKRVQTMMLLSRVQSRIKVRSSRSSPLWYVQVQLILSVWYLKYLYLLCSWRMGDDEVNVYVYDATFEQALLPVILSTNRWT